MSTPASWGEARPLEEVLAADLATPGVVFWHDGYVYRTTGEQLGRGGMGSVYGLERLLPGAAVLVSEPAVGKIFHAEYLYQLRTDAVTRGDHETTSRALAGIAAIDHPNVLPIWLAAPIADNHLFVAPKQAETLLAAIVRGKLPPRRRVELLVQALGGLTALHDAGFLHRDVTLRNVLVDDRAAHAYLFDFDLALALADVSGMTYRSRYQGRVFGSPGYSVPPEILDPALMDSAITTRLDVYAVGGALFALWTDQLPYGPTEDMWGLLLRIAEGIVFNGESRVVYPDAVPEPLRPIIDRCLERDPAHRYGNVREVIADVERCAPGLAEERARRSYDSTMRYSPLDRTARLLAVAAQRRDDSVSEETIRAVDEALERYGYLVQRSLGRVKGHPIFMVAPSGDLLAAGQFPDANTYPKIVTAIDLAREKHPERVVEAWLGAYVPALKQVRTGLMTALFKAVHDEASNHIYVFSEYVDDPRFGSDLEAQDLTLAETFGLGFLLAQQVGRLHEHGLAHNNVRAPSLLLKGLPGARQAHPSLVGLVDPSLDEIDKVADVRRLAGLVLSWIRTSRVESAEPRVRAALDEIRGRLAAAAFDEWAAPPGIDWLVHVLAEALSTIDGNFAVLRLHGGDLEAYALLLVSYSLYARLWER